MRYLARALLLTLIWSIESARPSKIVYTCLDKRSYRHKLIWNQNHCMYDLFRVNYHCSIQVDYVLSQCGPQEIIGTECQKSMPKQLNI